jgi:UDP:flavonoid glycosyltransferase YjiC (YdhE family)
MRRGSHERSRERTLVVVKILITALGTRGDVQPFVALGAGLEAAGHEVAVCAPDGFRGFVEDYGVRHAHMDDEFLRLAREALREIQGFGDAVRLTRKFAPVIRRSMDDEWRAILAVDEVPHDWLFPRTAAVVHHGGAGTTAAGLRAGKPAVVCPFLADQPFWGRVVHDRGVGPAPIPQQRLTAGRLAAAIARAVGHDAMRQRAASLGEAIRAEDGVANAVRVIDGLGNTGNALPAAHAGALSTPLPS